MHKREFNEDGHQQDCERWSLSRNVEFNLDDNKKSDVVLDGVQTHDLEHNLVRVEHRERQLMRGRHIDTSCRRAGLNHLSPGSGSLHRSFAFHERHAVRVRALIRRRRARLVALSLMSPMYIETMYIMTSRVCALLIA